MRCANILQALFIVLIGVCKPALGAEVDDPILGQWMWFTDEAKTFNADGSATKDGTWRCVNPGKVPRKYVIVWDEGKFVDVVVLQDDGNHLSGRNDQGVEVSAERLRPADSIQKAMVAEWKAEMAGGAAAAAAKHAPAIPDPHKLTAPGGDSDIMDFIFRRYPACHISVDSGPDGALDIYVSDEGIYAVQRKFVDPGNAENAALWVNWNFAVTADGVFEWQTGQKNGIKIARNDGDILGYLFYIIWAAGFYPAIYDHYLTAPDEFNVVPGKGGKWKEFQLKEKAKQIMPVDAIYLTEKPLWYYGSRGKTPDGRTVEQLVSAPEQIEKIPEAVKDRLRDVHFTDSSLTLARHMEWP